MDRVQAQLVFQEACRAGNLTLSEQYFDVLFTVADWLTRRLDSSRLVLGLSGAQGSGKSTLAFLLAELLRDAADIESEVVSLDDFYLTRAERLQLAQTHPLFSTRGVPGTHDLDACLQAVAAFRQQQLAAIPIFSKANDDRVGERQVDFSLKRLLIVEGWCFGAKPVSAAALEPALNALEAEGDSHAKWRKLVNENLRLYQNLFNVDAKVFLRVPDFASVQRWRWQQEQRIVDVSKRMTEQQINRFIMFYERITRQLLDQPGDDFDVCIDLNRHHEMALKKLAEE